MGGIASLAREAGHTVSGSDANVYPPMSTQLERLGIELMDLEDPNQFDRRTDVVVVGNVMSRGKTATEILLNSGIPYTSGPQWLAENILHSRHVLAVAGTHGKTTTSSMLAWMLQCAGLEPGFLIGGVPENFGTSARLGNGKYFVVEADEYDTAFFDKRSKFVHYHPHTLVLNNLEFDHADIFDDLDQIKRQFHHLIRTVPGEGRIICNADDDNLSAVLQKGCWTSVQTFSVTNAQADWYVHDRQLAHAGDSLDGWSCPMAGKHNEENGLAALAAANHAGVDCKSAMRSLSEFKGVARRLQLRGEIGGIRIFDDFAHHPTAVAATLEGVRREVGEQRVIAILEPRSNTMKKAVHNERLANALKPADLVWIFQPPDLEWDPLTITRNLEDGRVEADLEEMIEAVCAELRSGDHVVVMSNGAFGGIHQKLMERLSGRAD